VSGKDEIREVLGYRCPQCGSPLITNGKNEWCTFVGGGGQKACDYGLGATASLGNGEPSAYRLTRKQWCDAMAWGVVRAIRETRGLVCEPIRFDWKPGGHVEIGNGWELIVHEVWKGLDAAYQRAIDEEVPRA